MNSDASSSDLSAASPLAPTDSSESSPPGLPFFVGLRHGVDVAVLAVFGAVAFYFFVRGIIQRRPPSFFIALLTCSGWSAIALQDLGVLVVSWWLPWCGLVLGLMLLWTVVRFEATSVEPPFVPPEGL
jgi:hypothetical protein